MSYDLVAGDGGSKLVVTVKDKATDQPIDLTGKTVHFRYRLDGGAVVSRPMTVANQTTLPGQAEYTFVPADLAGNTMVGEVVRQLGQSDQVTSVETLVFSIRGAL